MVCLLIIACETRQPHMDGPVRAICVISFQRSWMLAENRLSELAIMVSSETKIMNSCCLWRWLYLFTHGPPQKISLLHRAAAFYMSSGTQHSADHTTLYPDFNHISIRPLVVQQIVYIQFILCDVWGYWLKYRQRIESTKRRSESFWNDSSWYILLYWFFLKNRCFETHSSHISWSLRRDCLPHFVWPMHQVWCCAPTCYLVPGFTSISWQASSKALAVHHQDSLILRPLPISRKFGVLYDCKLVRYKGGVVSTYVAALLEEADSSALLILSPNQKLSAS